jgi:hypothetical protein
MRFCAAHMRVRINERGQVNMRTAYDICGFLATENLISNPFEPQHSCLHGSSRHRRSNQLKYFKILGKCIVRGEIRTPFPPLGCCPRARPPHHISYLFKVRDELHILMFKIHIKILNFIKFNRIYKSAYTSAYCICGMRCPSARIFKFAF